MITSAVLVAAFAFQKAPDAISLSKAMETGFNLGNTFDLQSHSTDPAKIKPLIDLYVSAGMRHIRIPVTWMDEFGGDTLADRTGTIKPNHPRLKQLKQVVDYSLQKGLYVMINAHHERWFKAGYDGSAGYKDAFRNLWTGIATTFKDAPFKLSFEILNEPEGAFGDWSGKVSPYDAKAIGLTREMNQIGVEAVRATGGKNSTRVVWIMPNGQGNHNVFSSVYPNVNRLPGGGKDKFLGVSVHTYDPWQFCGQDGKNSAWPGEDNVRSPIKRALVHGLTLGVGMNYGEFGVGRDKLPAERNAEEVRSFYRVVRQTALGYGASVTPWDDRGWFGLTREKADGKFEFVAQIVPWLMLRRTR